MQSNLFLFSFFLSLPFSLLAQSIQLVDGPAPEQPYAELVAESWDEQGANFEILIENKGKAMLQIDSIALSCDCLSLRPYHKIPLPQDGRRRFFIQYKGPKKPFDLMAIIYSNAQNHPAYWLRLKQD